MSDHPKKTFTGSCICGDIEYEVDLALPNPPVATRCNCSSCRKSAFQYDGTFGGQRSLTCSPIVRIGYTGLLVDSADFRLTKPTNPEAVGRYTQRLQTAHRKFCTRCGAHIGGEGSVEFEGKKIYIFSINIGTLHQNEGELDFSKWKYQYFDGRNDRVPESLRDTPWPCTIP